MKKSIILLLIPLLLFSVVKCNKAEKKIEIKNDEEVTGEKTVEKEEIEDEFTNDDVITVFEENRKTNDYEILDSTLVDDKSTQIKAIILFDDKKINNSCNLAFIVENMDKENVVQEIIFVVNEAEGVRDFEIVYSHQEPNGTNFKIISNKHRE